MEMVIFPQFFFETSERHLPPKQKIRVISVKLGEKIFHLSPENKLSMNMFKEFYSDKGILKIIYSTNHILELKKNGFSFENIWCISVAEKLLNPSFLVDLDSLIGAYLDADPLIKVPADVFESSIGDDIKGHDHYASTMLSFLQEIKSEQERFLNQDKKLKEDALFSFSVLNIISEIAEKDIDFEVFEA